MPADFAGNLFFREMHFSQVQIVGKAENIGFVFFEFLLAGRNSQIADSFARSFAGRRTFTNLVLELFSELFTEAMDLDFAGEF